MSLAEDPGFKGWISATIKETREAMAGCGLDFIKEITKDGVDPEDVEFMTLWAQQEEQSQRDASALLPQLLLWREHPDRYLPEILAHLNKMIGDAEALLKTGARGKDRSLCSFLRGWKRLAQKTQQEIARAPRH